VPFFLSREINCTVVQLSFLSIHETLCHRQPSTNSAVGPLNFILFSAGSGIAQLIAVGPLNLFEHERDLL
jgi:hypothetical protein